MFKQLIIVDKLNKNSIKNDCNETLKISIVTVGKHLQMN